MNSQIRLRVLREVALRADRFQGPAERIGSNAAAALGRNKRAQITGLESAANSALKVTDVLNYIKLRTARHSEWRREQWGEDLLEFLTHELRDHKHEICNSLAIDRNSIEGLEVHLMLIREFARQLSAEYEYRCAQLIENQEVL